MKTMTVYASIHNSDRTEGRGHTVIAGLYESESDAIEASKGNDVQGSDGRTIPIKLIKDKSMTGSDSWYGPVTFHKKSAKADRRDELLAEKRKAIEKAKEAGLTTEDLEAIRR